MKLADYLEKTGIAIARFAKRCNLTYPQVRHILLGNVPTLETALRIAHYTEGDVAPVDLITDELKKDIYGDCQQEKDETEE